MNRIWTTSVVIFLLLSFTPIQNTKAESELGKKKGEMDSGTVFFMLCTGVITFMIFTGEQLIGPIIDIFLIPLGVMMIALPAIQARQIKYEIDQLKQKLNRY